MMRSTWIAAALAAMVLVVFWPVVGHDFVNYDDDLLVTGNRHVLGSLGMESMGWVFTSLEASNWHPLTWISHQLDVTLFGLWAGGHHLTSLLLHAGNAALLFLLLRGVTAATWPSFLVAALFAVHPLHVESVAWVSERKDVLSTFFGLLAMIAWLRYLGKPGRGRYAAVLLAYAASLMSKSMLLTLPPLLLLMDYWPLGRFITSPAIPADPAGARKRRQWGHLLAEKAPLLAMAAASGLVAVIAQGKGGSTASLLEVSLGNRIGNALVSYVKYAARAVWPADLSVFYPYPIQGHPLLAVVLSMLFLAGVTALVLSFRRFPYLVVGWAWYLLTLLPVIGLVQIGAQAMADRYTYFPLIGLFIMVSWGGRDLAVGRRTRGLVLAAAGAVALIVLLFLAKAQVGHWRDSESLFRHAIRVDADNAMAHSSLGIALGRQGRLEEAIGELNQSLKIRPDDADTHARLGTALALSGRIDEAVVEFKRSLWYKPDNPIPLFNLGLAMEGQGRAAEAVDYYGQAVNIAPDYLEARLNLASVLMGQGRTQEATAQLREALRYRQDGMY